MRWLILLLLCSPAWATWTLTQVKSNNSCATGTTCAVTVTSTGAGHLLVAGAMTGNSAADAVSTVTSAACASAWVHCPNCSTGAAGNGSVDLSYCLSSASGQTSITVTLASTANNPWTAVIWEASSSLGTIAIDSGAIASGTVVDTTCTACAGVALTLSGNNNFVAGLAVGAGSVSNLTGTGWTNDLANPNSDGVGHGITTGSQTAPTTWTMTSGTLRADAIAFQETAGGSVSGSMLGGPGMWGGPSQVQ